MTSPAQDAGTAARLRALLADVVELVQVRLELFTVEAREELARLARMAVLGALAVVLLSFGLIWVSLIVFSYDSFRRRQGAAAA